MLTTVTKIDQSKNGKTRVYFDGKNDWKDAFYIGNKTQCPPLNAVIDANTSSQRFNNSKYDTWFLNDWKPAGNAPQAAPTSSQTVTWPGAPKPSAGWNIESGDLSRFASNVIGSAIAAGLIKEPQQLMVWVAGAYRAAESLRSGKVEDFNDPIPQFHEDQGRDDEDFDGDSKIPF